MAISMTDVNLALLIVMGYTYVCTTMYINKCLSIQLINYFSVLLSYKNAKTVIIKDTTKVC